MSFGTASNYFTRSYGPNHRVIYEGVARLLADILVGTLDNIEDVEYSQLRAEFISTRLMYLVFPDEDSVPLGDTHKETIAFLLQTYEALLMGATKKSIDEVLNDIAEGNAVVSSNIEGYITDIKSAILATTEYNTDGVFATHRHFTFTDEKGLGSTGKPISFKWGDKLHTHDIVDGVIQPYIDEDGSSHTHNVFLGIPENIIRLQNNLRKVFRATKPAHLKTGEVSSIIDEDTPILTQSKADVFSPILGLDSTKTDEEIIEDNKIDSSLPYYNQNAQYGLVGLSLGSLYQEDMRKAREGVYEPKTYGYVSGKTIRFWRTNIKAADNLVIGNQKLRVISVSDRIVPEDGLYNSVLDENGNPYTYRTVRSLQRGVDSDKLISSATHEIINGCIYPQDQGGFIGRPELANSERLNDGEPVDLTGEVYFCDLMSDNSDTVLFDLQNSLGGHTIRLSYIEVKVDAQISSSGLQIVQNASITWSTRDQILYETVEFINNPEPFWENTAPGFYDYAVNLPAYIVKDMLKTVNGLPVSYYDLTLKINGADIDYNEHTLVLEHTNTTSTANRTNPQNHVLRIYDYSHETQNQAYVPLVSFGDTISLTYPKAKSEIRRFRELNSIEMTLNAARPTRKVSDSGRGIGQNRVIETTSPISYVLNEPEPITPFTQERKTATYSAGSSDLLNTKNQNLNTTYTLNNFALNQTATQEQVFKPATKTITTSNPIISFYELGFRPSFITSVVNGNGVSYTYELNKDHLSIKGLTQQETLTISGLSSNPFKPDLDWFKGEKLGEGAAFYKQTSTFNEEGEADEIGAFVEPTPEEYMTNPLGLVPDQIRSIYSMDDTQTTGVEGELAFYEDVITGYELDGRDGFTDEYNPHNPSDEWLYPDPTLYVLGPNFIPTYFFFGYSGLNTGGGDGFYFSLYRLDPQGAKLYQQLNLRADSNGFTALEQFVPNGAEIAYRFKDESLGDGSLDYINGNSAPFLAQINCDFNHIPNETYYLEVYMEEDNAGDYLYFLTSGTEANFDLGSSWATSPHAYRLDQNTNAPAVTEATYTYEITFTLNPGEVRTFVLSSDPNNKAQTSIENNTGTIDYESFQGFDQPLLGHNFSWKDNFDISGFIFKSVEDLLPSISDEIEDTIMRFTPVNEDSIVSIPTELLEYTLLLDPADITQSIGKITDDLTTQLNYVIVNAADTIAVISSLEYTYTLRTVNIGVEGQVELVSLSDSVQVPVFQRLVPSSTVPLMTDDVIGRISSLNANETMPSILDPDEGFLVSYAFLPRSLTSLVSQLSDGVEWNKAFVPINVDPDTVVSPTDSILSYITSFNVSSSVSLNDDVNTQLRLTPINESDTVSTVTDSVIAPIYQTLSPSATVSLSDSVATSTFIYRNLDDVMPLVEDSIGFFHLPFVPVNPTDSITVPTDEIDLFHAVTFDTLDTVSFNDFATAYISGTVQSDTVPEITVTDNVSTQIKLTNPYVYLSIRYKDTSYSPYVHIYKGEMDSLDYLSPTVYADSDGNERWRNPALETQIGSSTGPTSGWLRSQNDTSNGSSGAYTNSNDDAIARIGPLETDTEYTLYFRATTIIANSVDENAAVAMKIGTANETTNGYLSGETYTELGPSNNTFFYPTRYYYHKFTVRSQQYDIQFTQDTVMKSGWTGNTRVYFYIKNTANNAQEFYRWQIKEADYLETADNPASESNTDGTWIEPTLHNSDNTWPSSTYVNYSPSSTYNFTYGYYDDTNVNNVARLSYQLMKHRRYKLKVYATDNTFPDMRVFIRATQEDNGASYDTEYDSNSSLTYTELFQKDSNTTQTFRHFFYIRDDGFVVWEHDPNSRS